MAKKVLVVDDDPNTVRFLSVALEENGYEPIGAFDGKEGFDKAVSDKPDLVILDIMMPKRTGFTLFKQYRKDDRTKDIPVIMLTGVTASLEEQDNLSGDTFEQPYGELRERLRKVIQDMKEEGAERPEDFIEKPIDPEDFIERVRELIGD
jgi:DNA-binding response OmpR family regulator